MSCYPDPNIALQQLVGMTVRTLELSSDQRVLVFTHDLGQSIFATSQDCCEATWISDIIGVQFLLGQMVVVAEHLELPDPQDGRDIPPGEDPKDHDDSYRGCVTHYGVKLETTGGIVDIIFRTNSNGCYGGQLEAVAGELERSELGLQALSEDFGV